MNLILEHKSRWLSPEKMFPGLAQAVTRSVQVSSETASQIIDILCWDACCLDSEALLLALGLRASHLCRRYWFVEDRTDPHAHLKDPGLTLAR